MKNKYQDWSKSGYCVCGGWYKCWLLSLVSHYNSLVSPDLYVCKVAFFLNTNLKPSCCKVCSLPRSLSSQWDIYLHNALPLLLSVVFLAKSPTSVLSPFHTNFLGVHSASMLGTGDSHPNVYSQEGETLLPKPHQKPNLTVIFVIKDTYIHDIIVEFNQGT